MCLPKLLLLRMAILNLKLFIGINIFFAEQLQNRVTPVCSMLIKHHSGHKIDEGSTPGRDQEQNKNNEKTKMNEKFDCTKKNKIQTKMKTYSHELKEFENECQISEVHASYYGVEEDNQRLNESWHTALTNIDGRDERMSQSSESISIISDSQCTVTTMSEMRPRAKTIENVNNRILTNRSKGSLWCRHCEYQERGIFIDVATDHGHLRPCCFYDACIGEVMNTEEEQLKTRDTEWSVYAENHVFRVVNEKKTIIFSINCDGNLLYRVIDVGYHHASISNKQVHAYNGNINIPLLLTIIANLIVEQHIYSILIATAKGKSAIYLTDIRKRFTTPETFESMTYRTSRYRDYSGAIYYPNKILQASKADKYFYTASKIVSYIDGDYVIKVSNLADKKVQFAWYTQDNYPDYLNTAYTKYNSRVNIAKIYDDVGKDVMARARYLSETLKVRVYITNAAGYFTNAKHLIADDNKIPYAFAYGHVYAVSTFGQSVKNDKDISLVCMSIMGVSEQRCTSDPEEALLGTDLHHDVMGWYYCPSTLLDKVLLNTEADLGVSTTNVTGDFDITQTEIEATKLFNVSTDDIEIDGTLDGAEINHDKVYKELSINVNPIVDEAEEATEKVEGIDNVVTTPRDAGMADDQPEYFEAILTVPSTPDEKINVDMKLLFEELENELESMKHDEDDYQKDGDEMIYRMKTKNGTLPGHMCNSTHYKRMLHRSHQYNCLPITEDVKYSVIFGEFMDYNEDGSLSEGNAWKYLVRRPPGKATMTLSAESSRKVTSGAHIDLITLQSEIEKLNSTGRINNIEDYKKIRIIHDRRQRIQDASNELWRMLGVHNIDDYNKLLEGESRKTPVVALNKAIALYKQRSTSTTTSTTQKVQTYSSKIEDTTETITEQISTTKRTTTEHISTTEPTTSRATTLSTFLTDALQATTHWIGASLSDRFEERKATFDRNTTIEAYIKQMSQDTTMLCTRLVTIGKEMMIRKKRSAPNQKFFDNMQKCKSALKNGIDLDQNIIDNINILTGVSVFSVKKGSMYVKLPPVRFLHVDESLNVLNYMFKDMLRSLIYAAQVNRDTTVMRRKSRITKRSSGYHSGSATPEPIEMKNMGKVSALANTMFYRGMRWVSFTLENEPILLSDVPELSLNREVDERNVDLVREKFERENSELVISETRMETTGSIYDAMTSTAWYDIRQVKFIMVGEHIDLYNIEQQLQDLYPGLAYYEMFNAIMLNSYMHFVSLYSYVYEVPIMGTTLSTASENELMSQLSRMSYVEQSKLFTMLRQRRKKIPICLIVKPTREKETIEHIHRTTGMRPRVSGDYNTWSSYSPLVISTDPTLVTVCKFSILHEMTEAEFDVALQLTGFDGEMKRKKYIWYARSASVTMITPNFYSMQTAMLQYRNMIDTQFYGVLGLSN